MPPRREWHNVPNSRERRGRVRGERGASGGRAGPAHHGARAPKRRVRRRIRVRMESVASCDALQRGRAARPAVAAGATATGQVERHVRGVTVEFAFRDV